jgi:hypothetical protein
LVVASELSKLGRFTTGRRTLMSRYHVGLDVHKASIGIAVLDQEGKPVVESVVETSAATVLTFLGGLRGQVEVTFEEGTHAAWLYDVLRAARVKALVCDPRTGPKSEIERWLTHRSTPALE